MRNIPHKKRMSSIWVLRRFLRMGGDGWGMGRLVKDGRVEEFAYAVVCDLCAPSFMQYTNFYPVSIAVPTGEIVRKKLAPERRPGLFNAFRGCQHLSIDINDTSSETSNGNLIRGGLFGHLIGVDVFNFGTGFDALLPVSTPDAGADILGPGLCQPVKIKHMPSSTVYILAINQSIPNAVIGQKSPPGSNMNLTTTTRQERCQSAPFCMLAV
ncbi:hypothetical protein BDK51DRAFT_30558 [Blyttiomyces helicus]|uniref:Uncharacterized protein n=1 Tax=Blyttiomyces helicus TaxID=388810 RepID=A0A4P9WEB2_9FUNG|nr:hypothetical protein BDK51DRAFT_30558 [Blyttiomyces helicus]|eukprot:RKO89598.1 hypothetical protein BDK51DRAFT_30558 [Blyttiomyces helicus]